MTIKKSISLADQQKYSRFVVLKAAICEGLNSGISQRHVKEILKDTESKMRAEGKLQSALKV